MQILVRNIKELVQIELEARKWVAGKEMSSLGSISDAWLLIDNGTIVAFGTMRDIDDDLVMLGRPSALRIIDAEGRMVLPAFCDSHTHLVFPATREDEFVGKLKGLSYEEIARRGGGILNSSLKMQEVSDELLFESALERLDEIIEHGTGAVEIKSGYGLTPDTELRLLRVIRRLKERAPITIKATFLGAHAVPKPYKGNSRAYADEVIGEMIPEVAAEGLADYIDVFCDKGFFTVEDTDRILNAGMKYGLRPKIHANELDFSGGVQVGVKYNALSVDHLERSGKEEIKALQGSETMPVVLPGSSLFLGLPLAPVREMINAGLPVAMASDFNPGSSPSGNMQLILSLGCLFYRMLPEEAIHAVTLNGAYAMGVERELGTIAIGKKANLFITRKIPSLAYLPYAFGSNKVETVILNGKIYKGL